VMKLFVRLMPLFGQDPTRMGRNRDINYVEIVEHSYPIHAFVDTRAYAEQAERAQMCHASQLGGFGGPSRLMQFLMRLRRLLVGFYTETYMRACPPVPDGVRIKERDLFEGVAAD